VRDAIGGGGGPEDPAVIAWRRLEQDFIGACPDCGSQLAFIEGCAKCHVCGFSECAELEAGAGAARLTARRFGPCQHSAAVVPVTACHDLVARSMVLFSVREHSVYDQ